MNKIKNIVLAVVVSVLLAMPADAGIINILTGNQTSSTNYVAPATTNSYFISFGTANSRVLGLDMSVAGVTNTPAQTIGNISNIIAVFGFSLGDGIIQSNAVRFAVTPNGTTTLTNAVVGYTNVANGNFGNAVGIGAVPTFYLLSVENGSTNIIGTNIVINGFVKNGGGF